MPPAKLDTAFNHFLDAYDQALAADKIPEKVGGKVPADRSELNAFVRIHRRGLSANVYSWQHGVGVIGQYLGVLGCAELAEKVEEVQDELHAIADQNSGLYYDPESREFRES